MMPAHLFRLAALLAALGTIPARADPPPPDPDQDWKRRASAPGVVKAVGFDTIQEWARYQWDRHLCLPAYQVVVDGRQAGCRANAWDPDVKTSGRGALRFDVLPRSGENGAGNLVIPFGDFDTEQFGAGQEFWISWRQRVTPRLLQGYAVENDPSRITYFKQIIVSQGDMPGPGGKPIVANSCSESEIVVVSTDPSQGPAQPQAYMECLRYAGFAERLAPARYAGDARGSNVFSSQNMRRNRLGLASCITFPDFLDRSGCLPYRALEWMTFMIRVKLGPEGSALSTVSGIVQPGFTDSTFELYLAYAGQDFELLHRQDNVVFPRGQYYRSGDPADPASYKPGWSPHDAHPKARFGKLWLLPYMTYKDPRQNTETASTWYDEIIISRCRIAAPGFQAPGPCSPRAPVPESAPVPTTSAAPAPAAPPAAPTAAPRPAPVVSRVVIPPPESRPPRTADTGLAGTRLADAVRRMAPGDWLEVPDSAMARVQVDACRSPALLETYGRLGTRGGSCSPDHVMAFSGGAYDARRRRLLVWGGGHAGYLGNEIYTFEIDTGRWVRLTEPTVPVLERTFDPAKGQWTLHDPPWRPDSGPATPTSVHSYDQLVVLPEQDQLFAAGGSTFSGSGYASALTWTFDLDRTDATGWRTAEPMPANRGLYEFEMSTAYDPVSKRVIMRGYAAAATFDPVARTWDVGPASLPSRDLGTVGELDPEGRNFLVLGGGAIDLHKVDGRGRLSPPERLVTRGAREIEKCYAPGLAFDKRLRRFVAWCGGNALFSLDLASRTWTRHATRAGAPVPGNPESTPGIKGTYGRFQYVEELNAYIVVNGNRQNVFFTRLTDAQGRPAP